MKYKLPEHIRLIKYENTSQELVYGVLVKKRKVKEFRINETIYDFMNCFSNPTTLNSVITNYNKTIKASQTEKKNIASQLEGFLNQLLKKKWIVDENFITPIINYEAKFISGDIIGNYKITKVIANNELTDIYLAKEIITSKKVVVKYLNKDKFKDFERYKRYTHYIKDEFDFLKRFNSIYINKAYTYYHKDNQCFFTLRFVNGQSLFRYLRQHRLTSEEKLELVLKILNGFSIIHSKGVYHGDIHSGNVMITSRKQIKIIDFGYSNPVVPRQDLNDLKIRNGGSHTFIPPERALRSIKRKFNAVEEFQSEVYQIGLLIYYVYMKDLPFKAETWKTMVDEKKAFNIHEFQPFLKRRMPTKVRGFIIKSLENKLDNRFDNAETMLLQWKLLM